MSAEAHPAVAYLRRRVTAGDQGTRTTAQVADYCKLSQAAVRRALWAAVDRGEVEAFDGGASGRKGNPISWRAK